MLHTMIMSPLFLLSLLWSSELRPTALKGQPKVIIMVTFAETTMVSPMELCEPTCHIIPLSPGLRRKKMMWQKAVKHIIIQKELNVQVNKNNNKQQPHINRWTAADLTLNHFRENIKSPVIPVWCVRFVNVWLYSLNLHSHVFQWAASSGSLL